MVTKNDVGREGHSNSGSVIEEGRAASKSPH
jgi:hypothetical protein